LQSVIDHDLILSSVVDLANGEKRAIIVGHNSPPYS
jgi:hypothetical protein